MKLGLEKNIYKNLLRWKKGKKGKRGKKGKNKKTIGCESAKRITEQEKSLCASESFVKKSKNHYFVKLSEKNLGKWVVFIDEIRDSSKAYFLIWSFSKKGIKYRFITPNGCMRDGEVPENILKKFSGSMRKSFIYIIEKLLGEKHINLKASKWRYFDKCLDVVYGHKEYQEFTMDASKKKKRLFEEKISCVYVVDGTFEYTIQEMGIIFSDINQLKKAFMKSSKFDRELEILTEKEKLEFIKKSDDYLIDCIRRLIAVPEFWELDTYFMTLVMAHDKIEKKPLELLELDEHDFNDLLDFSDDLLSTWKTIHKQLEEKPIYVYNKLIENVSICKKEGFIKIAFKSKYLIKLQLLLLFNSKTKTLFQKHTENRRRWYSRKNMNQIIKAFNNNADEEEQYIFEYLFGYNYCSYLALMEYRFNQKFHGDREIMGDIRCILKLLIHLPNLCTREILIKELLEPLLSLDEEDKDYILRILKDLIDWLPSLNDAINGMFRDLLQIYQNLTIRCKELYSQVKKECLQEKFNKMTTQLEDMQAWKDFVFIDTGYLESEKYYDSSYKFFQKEYIEIFNHIK